jgi:hypothetical protein
MKYIILFLFLSNCFLLNAGIYYVDEHGSDINGDGSVLKPWATLAHACMKVTSPGDTIFINKGAIKETSQSNLASGVSITGTGPGSIISSTFSGNEVSTIRLNSLIQGTNGNQSISHIKLDGNSLSADIAIEVNARSNVRIHNCEIVDFRFWGVIFNGLPGGWGSNQPETYATGNEISECTIINCAGYADGWGRGCLGVGGQQDFMCFRNKMVQPSRGTSWSHGWCWKYYSEGFNKGTRIFNNHFIKAPFQGENNDWDFAMEFCMWEQGGCEIFNNIIEGEINLGARRKGDYDYSFYIHHNTIGKAVRNNTREVGIGLENVIYDLIIRYNYFHNLAFGLYVHGGDIGDSSNNVYIQYNIFDQIGNEIEGCGFEGYKGNGHGKHGHWYIDNNIFTMYKGVPHNGKGIMLMPTEAMSHIYVRNNIFVGWNNTCFLGYGTGSLDQFFFQNNLIYKCGSDNFFVWEPGYKIKNVVNTGNIRGQNPGFVTDNVDWNLQHDSPAKDAGSNINLTRDFKNHIVPFNGIPDIGACEYGSVPVNESVMFSLISRSPSMHDSVPYRGIINKSEIDLVNIAKTCMNFDNIKNPSVSNKKEYGSITENVSSLNCKIKTGHYAFPSSIKISPNPALSFILIKISGEFMFDPMILKIYKSSGEKIKNIIINSNPNIILPSNLSPGVYILQFLRNDKVIEIHELTIL